MLPSMLVFLPTRKKEALLISCYMRCRRRVVTSDQQKHSARDSPCGTAYA